MFVADACLKTIAGFVFYKRKLFNSLITVSYAGIIKILSWTKRMMLA